MIPEGLAGELTGGGGEQARERGLAVPVRKQEFTGGVDGAIEGGEEKILTDRESLVPFGKVTIQEMDEADLLGQVVKGNNITEGGNGHGMGLRDLSLLFFENGSDEVLGGAKVDSADDLGLAVDALAFADIVVGLAVNDLGRQAGHARNPPVGAAGVARVSWTIVGHTNRKSSRPSCRSRQEWREKKGKNGHRGATWRRNCLD